MITVSQQQRWNDLVESEWSLMREKNLPKIDFEPLISHFQWNCDETCVLSQDGVLSVIGSASKYKHDKTLSDNRLSITMFRCGSASGTEGPIIFLAKGKKVRSIP